jgi:adhesin transport system membrane fusion protein
VKDELVLANNMRAVSGRTPSELGWFYLLMLSSFILAAGLWAHWAVLDEVTTGEGKVVPTSRLQVVQALDGGVVRTIYVHDGDLVDKGQILLTLDDRDARSRLGELQQRRLALRAQVVRLSAEANNDTEIKFPQELEDIAPDIVAAEKNSFQARRDKFEQDMQDLHSELLQKQQELLELTAQQNKLTDSLKLMGQELELVSKLRKSGAIPEIDLIRLERQVVDARGELAVIEASLPRASIVVEQAQAKQASGRNTIKAAVREDLVKSIGELSILEQSINAVELRVNRTDLRAPARGIVNRLSVTSIGAVIQPGSSVVEIVPADDKLLIEVKVGPRDIGFIRKGQFARVKLTAFDYLQYGWFEGSVDRIGADTLVDQDNHPYFLVTVKTRENTITRNGQSVRAIPGMVASVDIVTGQKSVLQYLVSPVLRTRDEALRER